MLSNSFLQEPYDSLWHTTQDVTDCFLTHFFEQIPRELFQICQKFKAFTPSNMHFTLNHFMRFPLSLYTLTSVCKFSMYCSLYIFCGTCRENLSNNLENLELVIISFIPMTTIFDSRMMHHSNKCGQVDNKFKKVIFFSLQVCVTTVSSK